MLLVLPLLLCAAAVARAAGEYRTVEIEALKITIDTEWAGRTAPGYLPVRVDLTNLAGPRVIDIVGQGSRFFRAGRAGGQPGGFDILQSVRLARGDRVRVTIPVPIMADSENLRFEIREDGRTLDHFNTGFQSRIGAADASALIVADPSTPFGTAAPNWRRLATGRPGFGPPVAPGGGAPPLDFVLEPARLPTSWLGFTSLRAVFIGPKEWGQLNEPQKTALLTWVACGGDLMFVDGNLDTIFPATPSSVRPSRDLEVRAYLFGRIHATSSATIMTEGLHSVLANAAKLQDPNFGLPANRTADWGGIKARGFRLPIPGVGGVPARTYLTILIVFAFVIGPANYWFLMRKRQQVLIVLTAPLISAVFILLLGGYVLAGEGFGVRGRAMTFTMLDQARRQAVTRTSASMYAAGMTPSGGLRVARDVYLLSIGPDGIGSRDRHQLDLTEAQRFASGMIQARSPTNVEQILFRPARERLNFSVEGSGLSVVNGLDATVSALVYRRGNRIYTLTAPLTSGGRGTLTPDGRGATDLVPADLPLSSRFTHLFVNQPEGSYLAILDRSPFWDPGVSNLDERGSFHLVIGWPDGQP